MCKPFLTEKRFNYTQNILPESKKTLSEPQKVENIFNKHVANITKKKKKITNGNHLIIALTISLLVLDATLKYYANHPSVPKIKSFNPD